MTSASDKEDDSVGKGDIAGYQHFLLSHNVLRSLLSLGRENQGLFGKG